MATFITPGATVHLYVKGWELYEATVESVDGMSCSVKYTGGHDETKADGTMKNIDLKKMYHDHPKHSPVFINNEGLKAFGDGSFTVIVAAVPSPTSMRSTRSHSLRCPCLLTRSSCLLSTLATSQRQAHCFTPHPSR